MSRETPNPDSSLLANAVIGGCGMDIPPDSAPPPGMGVVVLYVPLPMLADKSAPDIQRDIGLPWMVEGGGTYWFDSH